MAGRLSVVYGRQAMRAICQNQAHLPNVQLHFVDLICLPVDLAPAVKPGRVEVVLDL